MKKECLPRKTVSLPKDISKFLDQVAKTGKRRTFQAAFEDAMRFAMAATESKP